MTNILKRARELAEQVLAPRAEAADRAFTPNPDTFRALRDAGFAGLTVKREFGGLGATEDVVHEVGEILGAACGVTYFTLHQHWSACGFIQQGDNVELQHRVLPKLASGEELSGVGFSHLRRPGPPNAIATEEKNGCRLSGFIPWFSGWGLYGNGVVAAKLSDGREIFVFTPVYEGPQLHASEPMALCAMQGSATVRLTFDGLFVPKENVCFIGEPNWLRNRDSTSIVAHAYNPLIVAAASIELLRQIAKTKRSTTIEETADALAAELAERRQQVAFWAPEENKSRPNYTAEALAARAGTILLSIRAAYACVVASAGAANAMSHPAQRYYREAMFYSIQGQTADVMEATLELLRGYGSSVSAPTFAQ